jgi:hypothetical protein
MRSGNGSVRRQPRGSVRHGSEPSPWGEGCPRCGAPVPPDAAFCAMCGLDLVYHGIGPAAPSGPGFAAPKMQIPPVTRHRNPLIGLTSLIAMAVLVALTYQTMQKTGVTQSPNVVTTYKLVGSAKSANITYTDGSGNIQQQTGVVVPIGSVSATGQGLSFKVSHGTFVSFSAQNNGATGDLTCSIEADGVIINTGHSSGGYAIVSCSAHVP